MKQPLLLYVSLGLLSFVLTGMALEPLAARDDSYKYLSNFADTLDLIQKNYVDEVALPHLMEGAYRGLLEELDPDSFYLDASGLKRFQSQQSQKPQADIGIDVSKRHGYAVVVNLQPGSAATGKLATGDYIRVIDGSSTREMSIFEIGQRLQGDAGSEVKLKVVRRETLETEEVTLKRALASFDPLETKDLADGTLLVHPRRLDAVTIERAAKKLKESAGISGLVLDLRSCSLGPIADGARLADLFLDSGVLIRVRGKTGEAAVKSALAGLSAQREDAVIPPAPAASPAASASPASPSPSPTASAPAPRASGYEYKAQARIEATVYHGPLVVLTDGGTAGPAEVAAAALRDAGRGHLVGSRSFGRAAIQDLVPLDDGAALRLTVAVALTPKGETLLGRGLEPDETVEANRDAGGDPALDKALEYLKTNGRAKKAA